jgi:hypothetical protein
MSPPYVSLPGNTGEHPIDVAGLMVDWIVKPVTL